MTDAPSHLAGRAAALRQAFDRSFAEEARRDTAPVENLLTLSLGAEPYAVRLTDIAGLYLDRRITPVPGGAANLLGIAGFRGSVIPVYDLAGLLGLARCEAPRWLMIAAGAPAALAFEAFDGHVQVAADSIRPRKAEGASAPLVEEFVSVGDKIRAVVRAPTVLNAIRAQLPGASRDEGE